MRLGATAIKNSVYVLPVNDSTHEDLQWVAREIVAEGGEATICTAAFVEGLRDDQIEAMFQAARDAEYAEIVEDVRVATKAIPKRLRAEDPRRSELDASLARMRKRMTEVVAIDFFSASGRVIAESAIAALEQKLRRDREPEVRADAPLPSHRGRTWVTRKNVHVDRIACAWLIRRFIDPGAKLKFVHGQDYRKGAKELTFDMFEGDFTHVGDRCSFETIVERFVIREPGLGAIAEIVHDIDVKDGKFGRTEAPGVAALIAGIALAERDDEKRIELGGRMLDALLELYRRKRT